MIDQAALSPRLLWAHIAQGAHQFTSGAQAGMTLQQRNAEIGNPQVAAPVHQQVGRLDVAVDHTLLMRMVQGLGRIDAQLGHVAEVPRPPARQSGSGGGGQ